MSSQHVSDAAASLAARLSADLGIETQTATAFAHDFMAAMLANGWAPTRQIVNAERITTTARATPEQVARYAASIRANLHPKESS